MNVDLPAELSEKISEAMLGVEIIEGTLVCPETETRFPIKDGIPNMLINEDQVWSNATAYRQPTELTHRIFPKLAKNSYYQKAPAHKLVVHSLYPQILYFA